ncbi:hypothetical protein SKAU_G00337640 [Synaphobranchus kaupii]|uniref:Uncharacterized protein n=1 Tax=Synaphobranchus kaupii TaxID=118154 RepID=A0A9Q1IGX8_SYNKA|nr:hypothetical protein SKAU_G00337640 [Synaphobranchus kaupii]
MCSTQIIKTDADREARSENTNTNCADVARELKRGPDCWLEQQHLVYARSSSPRSLPRSSQAPLRDVGSAAREAKMIASGPAASASISRGDSRAAQIDCASLALARRNEGRFQPQGFYRMANAQSIAVPPGQRVGMRASEKGNRGACSWEGLDEPN